MQQAMRSVLKTRNLSPLNVKASVYKFSRRPSSSGFTKGHDILGDEEQSKRTFVKAYGDNAFQINEYVVPNSVCLLPNSFLIWNCRSFENINIDSLSLFATLTPTLEILFIGCGENMPRRLDPELISHFRRKGIIVEAMSTRSAATTFNVLNGEGRNIAAALLTMKPLPQEDDISVLPSPE